MAEYPEGRCLLRRSAYAVGSSHDEHPGPGKHDGNHGESPARALAAATATFASPCVIYFGAFRLWNRFRDAGWQSYGRAGLAPVTIGLILASGIVMARAADSGWPAAVLTIAAAFVLLSTRLNPIWLLAAGGLLGGLGVLH